jgi:hypothetical protein
LVKRDYEHSLRTDSHLAESIYEPLVEQAH